MTRGANATWVSVQMSPAEKQTLDDAVAEAKKANPQITRNGFLRNWIRSLAKH